MDKKDKLYIGLYNDYYGTMLTEHQSELIRLYYDEDLSLGEIALRQGISPQGVRDALKRAERILEEYESKLGLVAKTREIREILCGLYGKADEEQRAEINRAIDLLDRE